MSSNVIIIGSGIAGLAASVRLAVAGYTVTVFESNDYPGGKLTVLEKDGFRFDAGPSLFTQPDYIADLFSLAGVDMSDFFTYEKLDVICHYFFENGKRINTCADADALANAFAQELGEDPEAIKTYLHRMRRLYDDVGSIFLDHSLRDPDTWIHKRILRALRTVRWPYLTQTLHQYNQQQFKAPETVQLFNRFATYNGSNPYQAPAMLSLIPHLEQNIGTFYPKGGMISITNAVYRLALHCGVNFQFNSPVEEILTAGKTAKGIRSKGVDYFADVVLSNADVYHTYDKLLRQHPRSKALKKMERSSSALIFYWGVNRTYPELGLHNIFFSNDYPGEFAAMFNQKTMGNDPTVYINITSKMEKGHAPVDSENWFVMINAPENNGQDWEALTAQTKVRVIEKLERIMGLPVQQHIVSEMVLDPVRIEQRTGTYKGSLYGTSSNSRWAAFLRPSNEVTSYKGLYFCGGTVHPGGGIPLCLKSAEIAAKIIQKRHVIQ